jgi:hypothetical protein
MDSLSSAMVGILMKNTNDANILTLDKASNIANRDCLKLIGNNASIISRMEGVYSNNTVRTNKVTIGSSINL